MNIVFFITVSLALIIFRVALLSGQYDFYYEDFQIVKFL